MFKKIAIILLKFYKKFLSPMLPPACRFTPTCSEYMMEAISTYGFFKGFFMGIKRLFKCHPFHQGGYDPVPKWKNDSL